MDVRLASAWTVQRILLTLSSQDLSVIGEYEHSSSKKKQRPFKWNPKHKMTLFFKRRCNDFD
jgi:hypothetical protein